MEKNYMGCRKRVWGWRKNLSLPSLLKAFPKYLKLPFMSFQFQNVYLGVKICYVITYSKIYY